MMLGGFDFAVDFRAARAESSPGRARRRFPLRCSGDRRAVFDACERVFAQRVAALESALADA